MADRDKSDVEREQEKRLAAFRAWFLVISLPPKKLLVPMKTPLVNYTENSTDNLKSDKGDYHGRKRTHGYGFQSHAAHKFLQRRGYAAPAA